MFSKIAAPFITQGPRIITRIYSAAISGQFAEFGPECRVSPPFRFANLQQVRMARGSIIHRDCWFHVVDFGNNDKSIKIDIGPDCGIGMGATISAAMSITFGDHVLLARNVYISDHRHTYEGITSPIMQQGIGGMAPVSIGRKTWLGQNVVVLPGVTIGEHCIIGANSVVKHDIPPYSVAAGAPARVVRQFDPAKGIWEKVASSTHQMNG